jgi:hypothetical protein
MTKANFLIQLFDSEQKRIDGDYSEELTAETGPAARKMAENEAERGYWVEIFIINDANEYELQGSFDPE